MVHGPSGSKVDHGVNSAGSSVGHGAAPGPTQTASALHTQPEDGAQGFSSKLSSNTTSAETPDAASSVTTAMTGRNMMEPFRISTHTTGTRTAADRPPWDPCRTRGDPDRAAPALRGRAS